jgi:hypothetical protein
MDSKYKRRRDGRQGMKVLEQMEKDSLLKTIRHY